MSRHGLSGEPVTLGVRLRVLPGAAGSAAVVPVAVGVASTHGRPKGQLTLPALADHAADAGATSMAIPAAVPRPAHLVPVIDTEAAQVGPDGLGIAWLATSRGHHEMLVNKLLETDERRFLATTTASLAAGQARRHHAGSGRLGAGSQPARGRCPPDLDGAAGPCSLAGRTWPSAPAQAKQADRTSKNCRLTLPEGS